MNPSKPRPVNPSKASVFDPIRGYCDAEYAHLADRAPPSHGRKQGVEPRRFVGNHAVDWLIHQMQEWQVLSDLVIEDALVKRLVSRQITGIDMASK